MASKYNVGDRVRIKLDYTGPNTYKAGEEYTIICISGDVAVLVDGPGGSTDTAMVANLELIEHHTPYTPITPKAGEKYRVVKDSSYYEKVRKGKTFTIKENKGDSWYAECGFCLNGNEDFLTTEYLELVSPASEEFMPQELVGKINTYAAEHYISTNEPINQSIIQKTMTMLRKLNDWQKRTFNKDIAVQYEVGFINEDLTPTAKAKEELITILLTEYNDKLTARAEEIKKEMLEAEKDK